MLTPEMHALARDFAARMVALVEADLARRVQGAIASVFPVSKAAPATRKHPRAQRKEIATRTARHAPRLSAKALAVRRLQGQYLGALRGLEPAARARVKKEAREKGVAAAVKLALSLR